LYSALRLAGKYLRYYITASNGKGHGIHSPFVFDFVTNVLNDKRNFYAYPIIENYRNRLLMSDDLLDIEDFGAGSVAGNNKQRKISSIVKNAAKSKKLGQLLFRIANYYKPASMVELGTSLGISSAYLATGNLYAKLVTCEGAASIASAAGKNFDLMNITNIEIVAGNFDDTLPALLKRFAGIDLAFIDGNHRKEPTLRYFNQLMQKTSANTILIFDDIHWSKEMEQAWQEIKNHPDVLLTIDLFFIGLVFFNPAFKVKQHFVIRF
jgi:predicted O-methyltransferase YrrM